MDPDINPNPKPKHKLISRSYLGNFKEADFAPMTNTFPPPTHPIQQPPFDCPLPPHPGPLSLPPNPAPFETAANPHPLFYAPQTSFHSNFLPLEPEYLPLQENLEPERNSARVMLKNILRSFGVQFYLKVLEEFNCEVGFPMQSPHFANEYAGRPGVGLGKRAAPGMIKLGLFNCLENNEAEGYKTTFKIQKLNLSSTKNESLYSLLNGNIKCPLPFSERPGNYAPVQKVTSIDNYEPEDKNPRNILSRLYDVICGESPASDWFIEWDALQTQIFWLLLHKMGVLPEDWQLALQKSYALPRSSQKLQSVSHKTNMLVNRVLIKILNRFYYEARDRNCPESEGVLQSLLSRGKSSLINKDFLHFSKIVGLQQEDSKANRFVDINKIQNQYLNRKMKDVLCGVLIQQTQTQVFYQEVRREVLTEDNRFQSDHKKKVNKKLRMAISKIEKFLGEGGNLPGFGVEMDQEQRQVLKKLKIPPPLDNWVNAFEQVDELLSLIPPAA